MKNDYQAPVIWITGLSDAGKTSTSKILVNKLRNDNQKVIALDGDELRKVFKRKDFSIDSRVELGYQYSNLCQVISSQGILTVISCIALIKEIHQFNKKNIKNYFDVFLDVPIEILKKRDSKGIYKKFSEGTLENVYGLDINYDPPISPKVHIKYNEKISCVDAANIIYDKLNHFEIFKK
tara:strand:+ start:2494 stop:3033 length:540 start_codon:yes stop_codon:yes gene_type:complete